jgi:DNA repair exonuclease SbcCD ATPase subunit
VWVFSTLKGYSGFDDPYPDYGKLDRAVRDAAETVSARRAAAREALEAPIEQARSLIEAQLAAAAAAVARVRARYDEACADLQAMEAETRRADDAAAGAIEIYRRERLAHSNGHEPPVFATLPPSAPFTDALARAADVRLAAEQEIAAMQAQATAKLEELSRELDAISARLEGDS